MVFNTFIKCQVCGCITRVRLQVGWQEEHPIEVACGKCGTSLSGSVKIGQDRPGLSFSFDNADEVQDENADYIIECSGEFPTLKQVEAADLERLVQKFLNKWTIFLFCSILFSSNQKEH